MRNKNQKVYILAGMRTPFTKSFTNYKGISLSKLLEAPVKELVEKNNLKGKIIGEDAKLSSDVLPSQSSKIVVIKDVKPNGTAGGGCDSAGVWYTRNLNQISGEGSFADLNNNQVTLSVGKYLIEATAPAYLNNIHKAVLVNASTNAVLLAGSNGRSHVTAGGSDASVISGVIELSNDTILEIRHRCSVAKTVDGFGVAAGFGISEVYTQLKITKID